ncbi:MAG: DUF2306 domain-containing protein [Balneolaceae bacterium]|nr:DUF2306 domain-containing protein [Balneolaceae bacterium]
MSSYQFDLLGGLHFAPALLAMFFGAFVLFRKKGGPIHIKAGYAYSAMMLLLNVSALLIYKLFGKFGPFHIAAVISLVTLLGGLIPAYLRKPKHNWLEFHYEFMNWSVIGLYAAFWSETFSRFFRFAGFWVLVATATAITVAVGAYLLKSRKKKILEKYQSLASD